MIRNELFAIESVLLAAAAFTVSNLVPVLL